MSAADFYTEIIPDDDLLWTSAFFNERFPQVVSPLGWSLVKELVEVSALVEPLRFVGFNRFDTLKISKLYRGRPFVNVQIFQMLYKFSPESLLPIDAHRFFPGGDTGMRKEVAHPRRRDLIWGILKTLISRRHWHPLHHLSWKGFVRKYDLKVSKITSRIDRCDSPQTLLEEVDQLMALSRQLLQIHRWSLTYAESGYGVLRHLVEAWTGFEDAAELCAQLVGGLSNKSTELDTEIWKLATRAQHLAPEAVRLYLQPEAMERRELESRPNYALGVDLAQAFDRFLAAYGHRSMSLDILQPTYAQYPEQVVEMIVGLLEKEDARDPAELLQEGADRRDRATGRVKSALTRRFSDRLVPLRWWIGKLGLWLLRIYMRLREDQRFYWQKSIAGKRQAFVKLGAMLSEENVLADPEAVFFLTRSEIERALQREPKDTDWQALSSARKDTWEQLQTEACPSFLRGNTPLEKKTPDASGVLRGIAVSPGVAQGEARIIVLPPDLARAFQALSPGDILVTRATDPAWTPIFPRLGGLVMEVGGQLSHGSIVAREYGIPAVVGVQGATDLLQDGELIRVDGISGTVTRLQRVQGREGYVE
jgi:pyruvate,water dikinase